MPRSTSWPSALPATHALVKMDVMSRHQPQGTKSTLPLTRKEQTALDALYVTAGAWTPREAHEQLGSNRTTELLEAKHLGRFDTEMGPMLVLLTSGRLAVFGVSNQAQSLHVQLDRAYLRLSLKALGWTRLSEQTSQRHLTQYDPTGSLLEVQTDHGPVLLAGSMRSGGYSRQQLERLTLRLKSMALKHRFDVVVLTPHPRKGRDYAQKQSAFLVLKTILPRDPDFPEVTRVKRLPTKGRLRDDEPYLAGQAWKHEPKYAALPDLTREILQQRRRDRIDWALRSLDCDGALSDAQLQKYYGLDLDDLSDRPYIETIMRPIHGESATEIQTRFVVAGAKFSRMDESKLGHRVGTSEIRHQLGLPPEQERWRAERRESRRFEEPDAHYFDTHGLIHAIEFDTGTYTLNVIDDKLTTFRDRGFEGTIWGVTGARRQQNLTQKIGPRLERAVLLCEWWKP